MPTAFFVPVFLASCSDVVESRYPSWSDAQRAGAVGRGWIPRFVPRDSKSIIDLHDLDTNSQTLEFTTAPATVEMMVSTLRPVSAEDQEKASKLSHSVGLPDTAEAFVVCSKPLNGILVVNRSNGASVYRAPIPWADDDCL